MHFYRLVLVCALGFAWFPSGCATRECAPERAAKDRAKDSALDRAQEEDLKAAVRARLTSRAPEPSFNVLVLSGGGAYGAWGAGVLSGWRQATGGEKKPQFDVVTGISTGALLSTFAFLGTEQDDATMKEAYTTLSNEDVFRKRFILFVPFSHSLFKTAKLKERIDHFVNDDVIRRVAKEQQSHRRLYVGTVNLDAGRLKIWDMTALAAAGEFEKYRQVIYAATAIPVMFEPVMIDGQMHVDGGTRAQLFLRKRLLPIFRAFESEKKAVTATPAPPLFVWVLVNGSVGLGDTCVNDHILPIAMRSAEALIDAGGIGDLYRTKTLADENHFPFRLCYYDVSDPVGIAVHDFVPAQMLKLFNQGVEWGRRGKWYERIPAFPEDEF